LRSPCPGVGVCRSKIAIIAGPASVRRFLPELIDLVWNDKIKPGKVFDLILPPQRFSWMAAILHAKDKNCGSEAGPRTAWCAH